MRGNPNSRSRQVDDAATLKQKGNEFFKAGRMAKAAEFYAKAEKADSNDPVYPSNLSAALYEIEDYANCVNAVIRAWRLLKDSSNAKQELVTRLSSRLAKALSYGARAGTITQSTVESFQADITLLQKSTTENPSMSADATTTEELARVWKDWETIRLEIDQYTTKRDSCLRGHSELPIFVKPLVETKEFFSMGHDEIIDLTAGWGLRPHPLSINNFPSDQLSKLAFMFGGVGDGRHVLGTLSGLFAAYKKLSKAKQDRLHAHLTLLDIHEGTIARDLCILMLLHELGGATDKIARAELAATLMYMFCGVAMPPYCFDRLQAVVKDLLKRLLKTPSNLPPWLHVTATPVVMDTLTFWASENKSTSMFLAKHEHVSDSPDIPAPDDIAGVGSSGQAAQRRTHESMFLSMADEQLARMRLIPPGGTAADGRQFVRENLDAVVDGYQKLLAMNARAPTREEKWYTALKVYLPPPELCKRHPGFVDAWKQAESVGKISPQLKRKATEHIEKEWKPNITLLVLTAAGPRSAWGTDCYSGYPKIQQDMFETISFFDAFNCRNSPKAPKPTHESVKARETVRRETSDLLAWRVCRAFFEEAAAALRGLEKHVTVECVVGGLSEELLKMRLPGGGDKARPEGFPKEYTRMWLSNVPDYTHGLMNLAMCVIPNLQESPEAAVASNSLFNSTAWSGAEEFIHTYTLLSPKDVPRYLGCNMIFCDPVIDLLVLGRQHLPRPLSDLATREELTTWLTRVLFNTFVPGRSAPRPTYIMLPHNLVAFFWLLMHLHRVGYPAHWLSEFLARVLSGQMLSDVRPYDDWYPIPTSERTRRVQTRTVRTDPWLVEFETIIATAYYAIPFPVRPASLLSADFSRNPDDIAVWEAAVEPARYLSPNLYVNPTSSPYDPQTELLFYRSDETSPGAVVDDIRRIFEGKRTPRAGAFFILTAQERVNYEESIRFRLSRKRIERMRREKWSMVAYRNDTREQATLPVPIENWVLYDDHAI